MAAMTEEERKEYERRRQAIQAEVEAERAGKYAEPSMLSNTQHVLKGFGRNVLDALETPYAIEQLGFAGGDLLGFTDPMARDRGGFTDRSTQPWTKTAIEGVFGEGAYDTFSEAVAGDVIDPETPSIANYLRTGAEWVGPGLIRNSLRAATEQMGKVARTDAPEQLVSDVIVGGGAATGELAAQSLEPYVDLNLDQSYGELGGGGVGMITNLLRGRAPIINPQALDIPRDEASALNTIASLTDDAEAATQAVVEGIREGQRGTFGVLASDANIQSAESQLAAEAANAERMASQDAATRAQATEQFSQQIAPESAPPGLVQSVAQGEVDATQARIDAGLEANRAQAQQAADAEAARLRAEAEARALEQRTQGERRTGEARTQAIAQADEVLTAGDRAGSQVLLGAQADADRVAEEAAASAERIRETGQTYADDVTQSIERLDEAENVYKAAIDGDATAQAILAPKGFTYEISQEAFDALNDAEKNFYNTKVRPSWRKFRNGQGLPKENLVNSVNAALDFNPRGRVDAYTAQKVREKYGNLIYPKGWENRPDTRNIKAANIQRWLSDMKEEAYRLDADGRRTPEQIALQEVVRMVEDELSDVNPAFRTARDSSREQYQRFREGRLQTARRQEPEMFAQSLNLKGDSGAAAARYIRDAGDQEFTNKVGEFLKAEAQKSGGVTPEFIEMYRPVIEALPSEMMADFFRASSARSQAETATGALAEARAGRAQGDEAVQEIARLEREADRVAAEGGREAGRVVTRAEGEAEGLAEAAGRQAQQIEAAGEVAAADQYQLGIRNAVQTIEAGGEAAESVLRQARDDIARLEAEAGEASKGLSKSTMAKIAQEPVKELRALMTNPDRADEFNRLVEQLSNMDARGDTTEAVDALKQSMRGIYERELSRMSDSQLASRASQVDFGEEVARMQAAGILSEDAANRAMEAIRTHQTVSQRQGNLRNLSLQTNKEFIDTAATTISAALATGLSGTQTLLLGGLFRRRIKKYLEQGAKKPAVVENLENFMYSPETYVAALENLSRRADELSSRGALERWGDQIMDQVIRLGETGQALATGEEEED